MPVLRRSTTALAGDEIIHDWCKIAVLLLGASFVVSACAQNLGREWKALDPEQSAIVFPAPGLETQKVRIMRSYNERQSLVVEYAKWVGPGARHAKAQVRYYRTSPGYHFRRNLDPQALVENSNSFRNKSVTLGAAKSEVNRLGRISHRSFDFDNVHCVMFQQLWGASEGAGDQQLIGYYCADPGQPLDDGTIKQVVRSVDIR